jgi:1-acyl-sn-glycerol-3-phosphate acyltransferase
MEEPAQAFMPQPIPGFFEGLRKFGMTAAADPVGGLRLIGRATAIVVPALVLVPAHYLWRALGLASPWPRPFLRLVARACGMRVAITGTPLSGNVLFVANHLSWIDIPALGGVTGAVFVAQDRINDWPVFGWLARLNDTIFVSRSDRMQVGSQVAALRAALARHPRLALFPEGTTTDGSHLLPFKAPLFAALDPPPPGLMIQPVVLDFDAAGRDLAWIGVETAPANAWRVFRRKGSFAVTLHFLEPFDPASLPGRKAVSAECRRRIEARLLAGRHEDAAIAMTGPSG